MANILFLFQETPVQLLVSKRGKRGCAIRCLWRYYGCFMGRTQLISQQLWLHFTNAASM